MRAEVRVSEKKTTVLNVGQTARVNHLARPSTGTRKSNKQKQVTVMRKPLF